MFLLDSIELEHVFFFNPFWHSIPLMWLFNLCTFSVNDIVGVITAVLLFMFHLSQFHLSSFRYSSLPLFFAWTEYLFKASPVAQQWRICPQCRRHRRLEFDPWFGEIPWRREWQPTSVFLPEKSRGQKNLVGNSPWGRRVRNDWLSTHVWIFLMLHFDSLMFFTTCF